MTEVEVYGGCYNRGFNHGYGQWPGADNRDDSQRYMQNQHVNVMVTRTDDRQFGNTAFRSPVAVRTVPSQYQQIPAQNQRFANKPIPVGAVVSQHGVVPPTNNGHGISAPPFVHDPNSGTVKPLPPVTQHPAQPNPNNPIFHRPESPTQPGKIQPIPPSQVNNGNQGNHQPQPVHTQPQPQPVHTDPQPQPQSHSIRNRSQCTLSRNRSRSTPHPQPQPSAPSAATAAGAHSAATAAGAHSAATAAGAYTAAAGSYSAGPHPAPAE